MHSKKWQKHSNLLLVLTMLLNLILQAAAPFTVYAETEGDPIATFADAETETLTITEVLSLEGDHDELNILGYIVGHLNENQEFVSGTEEIPADSTDILLADSVDETDKVQMLVVKLTQDVELDFELVKPGNHVVVKGMLTEGVFTVSDLALATTPEEEIDNPDEGTESGDEEEVENFELSVMHMNDTHARVEAFPKMVTAINEFRAEKPNSLLLHAGDVFSGTLYFTEHKGQADLALMNLMGIDAMVFGNHEFDLGSTENGHKSLSEFVKKANFPFLGTNVDFSGDPYMKSLETKVWNTPTPADGKIYNSIIKEVDGEKIGIFGLVTEDTKNIASPMSVTFSNYIQRAREAVANFEAKGVNKIIALTHIGYNSTPAVGNDLILAAQVDGIDIIVGGHSHTSLNTPVVVDKDATGEAKEPTVIVQAGQYVEHLGTLTVEFDENGVVVENEGELLLLNPSSEDQNARRFEDDPTALSVLEPFKAKVDELNNQEIGATAMKDLLNPRLEQGDPISVRANETELGNLVTDAMLAKAKEKVPETVIAFQNGGGIRAPIMKGPITVGEVINVLPFGNNPVVAELTGQEIKDILERSVKDAPNEYGGFLHVSGLKFTYDTGTEENPVEPFNRVKRILVIEDGVETELELNKTYVVTTNGFTGQGGDGYEEFAKAFAEGRVRDIGESDWEQLVDYMVSEKYLNGVVDPEIEGRIIDLKGAELPPLDGETEEPVEEEPKEPIKEEPKKPEKPADKDKKDSDKVELPKTGTDDYMYLIIGSSLLASGALVLIIQRRKTAKR